MDIGVSARRLAVYYATYNSSRISHIALQENPRYIRIKFSSRRNVFLTRSLNKQEEEWYRTKEKGEAEKEAQPAEA